MFKFFINNTEILENPEGWESLTTTVKLDRELKGLLTLMDVSLTFWKDGHATLKTAWDTYGYCYSLPFEVRQHDNVTNAYLSIFTGTLFMRDVEFTEGIEGYSAKCQITDNGFQAKIFNNRNLKAKVYVGSSKNGVLIPPAEYKTLQLFRPSTGNYFALDVGDRCNTAFKAFDVLQFFVRFMSDGAMDFYSDTFGPGGKHENYLITIPYIARLTTQAIAQDVFQEVWPDISFSEVYRELDIEFDLGFVASFDGGRPYFRVEEYNYLFPPDVVDDLAGIDKLKRKVAAEFLYGKLIVGSEITEKDLSLSLSFPEDIRFVGPKREEYYIAGQCNNDREKDLVNKWIISSNVIEDNIIHGKAGTDDIPTVNDSIPTLIHVDFDAGVNYKAHQSNWLAFGPPYFYNEQLNTNNKVSRHLQGIPSSIVSQLEVVDNSFSAYTNDALDSTDNGVAAVPVDVNPVDIDQETSDPNNNFDPTTNSFIAPVGGVYTFNVRPTFDIYASFPGQHTAFAHIQVFLENITQGLEQKIYDNDDGQSASPGTTYPDGHHLNLNITSSLNLISGDNIQLRIYFTCSFSPFIHVGSLVRWRKRTVFSCTASADGGGVYASINTEDYPVIRSVFDYPYSFTKFRALLQDPRGTMSFGVRKQGTLNKKYYGHIEELKYKNSEGVGSWTMISTEKINK